MELDLSAKIEAFLFWKAEPVAIKKIAEIFKISHDEVKEAINVLDSKLAGRGLVIVRNNEEVMLGTNPAMGELIEKLTKEELNKDIGKAGLETLAIIIYQGPITRRDIDYIRGVNSSFILRNLQIRGLVEKIQNDKDQRTFLYRSTFDLLSYLGLKKIEDMPEFQSVKTELEAIKSEATAQTQTETDQKNAAE